MAISYSKKTETSKGQLVIDKGSCVVFVHYEPSIERLKQTGQKTDDIDFDKKLLLIFRDNTIVIHPINTHSTTNFMEQKYLSISSIVLHNFFFEMPETIEDVENILKEKLPQGFITDYDSGLGLLKGYRFIIQTLEENTKINCLRIYNCPSCKSTVTEDCYHLNITDYKAIIKGAKKINDKLQSEKKIDKSIFAYNSLLNKIDSTQYPKKHKNYQKDILLEFISSNDVQQADLSQADQEEVLNLVSKNTQNIAKNKPESLMKLHNDIELVSLESLIERFEILLNKKSVEDDWQYLFNNNPFILSLAFAYPIIKFGEQIHVGGRTFWGVGGKITDFLIQNNLTDNSALIEIKTPDKPLLNKKPYRESKTSDIGSVYSVSSDLSGAINQLLDQKYKLQQEISQLKITSRMYDIESYSIGCLLIIGKTPETFEQKKSFELFRGNSRDIEIITFDELLEKLRQLHSFLLIEPDPPDIPF